MPPSSGRLLLHAVAAAGLLACTTCGDDVRIERYPIGFEFLGYPDTLVGDGTDTLRIGAIVGYDRCQLEALEIAVRGDSLVVSGTARCEVHEDPRLVAAKITTPPASPNRQWIVRSLSLAPGRYFVRAGTLRDTLVVAGPTAAATRQRIVTRGMVIPSRCWYFQGEVFWECQYVLDRPPWPGTPLPYPVELHATETAPLACDTTRASLRVRSPLP